jgi:RimJ/RimL family protein N-acetyltransferase
VVHVGAGAWRVLTYIRDAAKGQSDGHMLPWAVRDLATNTIVGSTRYHDIVPAIDRVEIGYTWYAARCQRTNVNTTCKLLLLEHAFETLGCAVVGLRTDNFNFRSQKAIEALGAKKDGVLRAHQAGATAPCVIRDVFDSEGGMARRSAHLELRTLHRHGKHKSELLQRTLTRILR